VQLHPNARTTPRSRAQLVDRVLVDGWSVPRVAQAFHVSRRTVFKWLARYRAAGAAGLADRSPAPRSSPQRTPVRRILQIVALRAQRLPGHVIARRLGVPRTTVSRLLRRQGLGRLPSLMPRAPIQRYERGAPGELLHVDIKSLGRIRGIGHRITGDRRTRVRGIGWEHVHVCIDDASRLAYAEVLATAAWPDAVGFIERAIAWFAAHGVRAERVMTDNGSAYLSRAFAAVCARLAIRHLRTRAYTPRTNGKAERFIQTLLREWAYRRPYRSSARRRRALDPWLRYYNRRRPHMSLNYLPPISRLQETPA
jgi:transposase InsO family protein